ncbi:MAG TPA: hypothetical protein VF135_13325 [Terriglobales bacterium]
MRFRTKIVLMMAFICFVASAWASPGKKLANGLWGGSQLRMEVNDAGAELDFGCGSATIAGPITLDQNGNFAASGTYQQGSFGPTREGASAGREASFTGSVQGNTLKLEMVLSGEDRVQKFTVTRGKATRMIGCK